MKSLLMNQRRFSKVILVACVVLMQAMLAYGQYKNIPVRLTQPDGSTLKCYVSGSKDYNWIHDANGYTIIQDPTSGTYVYAREQAGALVPSVLVVGDSDPSAFGIPQGLKHPPSAIAGILRKGTSTRSAFGSVPSKGTINTLVAFIRFLDQEEFSDAPDVYDSYFNDSLAGHISLRNYYREISGNSLDIRSHFIGVTGGTITSFQDTHPRGYYTPYNQVTNAIGYQSGLEGEERLQTLLKNALQGLASGIPAGVNFDANGDGTIDNITFVVRGDPTGWSSVLWPHMSAINSAVTIAGKLAGTYNFQIESFLKFEGVSVLCHEMFHSIGAPDLYHYSLDNLNPVAGWDLMAENAVGTPQHPLAYMKYRYGHWLDSIPEIRTSGKYVLHPQGGLGSTCFKILSPYSAAEFFVVEYRNPSSTVFESALPGSGLLVTRVNSVADGQGDAGLTDELYVYRPKGDPLAGADGFPNQATLSFNAGRTGLNDHSDPPCALSNGGLGGLRIDSVSAVGDSMTLVVAIASSVADIRLTAPSGAQILYAGTPYTITWASTGIDSITITLSTDCGATWSSIVDRIPSVSRHYSWVVPTIASSGCLISVASAENAAISDRSSDMFTITSPAAIAAGLRWEKISSGDLDGYIESIGENANGDLYATAWPRRGIIRDFRSTDHGATWDSVLIQGGSSRVAKWAFSPGGKILASDEYNLFLSTDNGSTWSVVRLFDYHDYVFDYQFAGEDTIQVLTKKSYCWTKLVNNMASGWTDVKVTDFPGDAVGAMNLSKMQVCGSTIYVASFGEGLYKSTDAGATWHQSNTGLTTMTLYSVIALKNGTLLIGSKEGIFVSQNQGASWLQVADSSIRSSFIISFVELPDGRVVAGSYGCHGPGAGAFLSCDGGLTWSRLNDGLLQTSPRSLFVSRDNYLYTGVGYGDASLPGGIYRIDLLAPLFAWKSRLSFTEVASGNVGRSSLLFGQSASATLGRDPGLRETSESTNLIPGELDGSFVRQDGSGLTTRIDYRSVSDTRATWKINLDPGTLGFPVRLRWQLDSTIACGLYLVDSASSAIVDMRKVSSYDVTKNGTLIITNNEAVAQVQLPAAHQPFAFHLAQNYPNPFNPSTVIAYTIPEGGDSRKNEVGRKITLIVYDILGREVVTLVNEVKQPGNYSVRFDAGTRASGLYLYRLTAGGFTQTKAMMLVK